MMKRFTAVLFASLMAVACFAQTITKMELAKDNGKSKPGEVVKSFAVSDNPIHCVVHLKPLDVTTVLTGTLIAVEAEKYRNFTVATTNITGVVGTTSVDFKFGVAKSWPEGSYKFLIKTADGKLQKEISFEIK